MTDPDLDKVVETIKRNVPSAISGNPYAPLGSESQAIRNASCEAQNLNIANAALARRGTVTMNKPLEPWPLNAFHKTLAVHIHNATRPAKHSHLAANYGIMDNEQDARRWDFEGVK